MHEHKTNSDSSVLALDTRDNKLISKSSVFKLKSASDTRDNKLISKQYPSCKKISGASTKPTQTQLYRHQIPETIIN